MDEKNNWGYRRIPGFRKYKKGDVILFRALDGSKNILVKRIEHIYKDEDNGDISYYVLGDNRNNSADSRCFGLVPDSLVVGMARRVLFSWDNEAKGLNKVRWKRIGYDITESKGDMQRDDE